MYVFEVIGIVAVLVGGVVFLSWISCGIAELVVNIRRLRGCCDCAQVEHETKNSTSFVKRVLLPRAHVKKW